MKRKPIEVYFGLGISVFCLAFMFMENENGEPVPDSFKIFALFFLVLGIIVTIFGIKKHRTFKEVEEKGEYINGQIIDIFPNGTYLGDKREMNGDVVCLINGVPKIFTTTIGFGYGDYYPGAYVKVKYHNGNISLAGLTSENSLTDYEKITFVKMLELTKPDSKGGWRW